jgi:tRNA (guanosine-2'-O-)-methyltransferase
MIDAALLRYLEGFISPQRKSRFEAILQNRTKHITVAVEDVYQMHNTSAVIRSCEVFGIQEAHLIESRYGKRLDKNIAMGAEQWVTVHRHGNTKACMEVLRNKGYKIIATTPHDDSCLLNDFKLDKKVALFFGTERAGLSAEVMDNADGFLKIPMMGFTESLNISVSAAIILQDLTSRLRTSSIPWQLAKEEELEVKLEWTKRSISSIDGILERYASKG